MILGRTVLSVSALVFTAYALVSVVAPELPAGFAGLEMTNGDAYAEVGAMYGGLQAGIGLFCLLAARNPDFYRAGLVLLFLAVGLLAIARLYSTLSTELPVSPYTLGAIGYEFVTALLAGMALRLDAGQR